MQRRREHAAAGAVAFGAWRAAKRDHSIARRRSGVALTGLDMFATWGGGFAVSLRMLG